MSHGGNKQKVNCLRKYRLAANLTQIEAAHILGLRDESKIGQWERGEHLPTLVNTFRLAACYGVLTEALYLDLYREVKAQLQPKIEELYRRKEIEKKYG